jgi:hypothetical protein
MDTIVSFIQNNTVIAIVIAVSPLLYVPEAQTVFRYPLPWALPL